MAFSPQFLDELRARVGLADVIGRRVRLVKKGREHSGLCPFHKEKSPSFTVNEDKGFYHCFGCGAHGSVFDFVMQTDGLSFPEAVERLAADVGMAVPVSSPEEAAQEKKRQSLYGVIEAACLYFQRTLNMPEGRAGLDYLKGRGLSDATIKTFRLGFALDSRGALKAALTRENISEPEMIAAGLLIEPEDTTGGRVSYDRFRGRVMFPIADRRGRVVAFGGRVMGDGEPKYLNSPETPLFHKGHNLYALDKATAAARKAGTVIVAEGYMDVIALHQAGFEHAVAPLGTALTEDQIRLLWKLVPEPVLCFDGDAAGARAANRAAERVLPLLTAGKGLRFAILPAGEDPDSLVKKSGVEAMAQTVVAALPLSEILWRAETQGKTLKTPEQRAAVETALAQHAQRIQDSTVRGHFLRDFKDRMWKAARADRPARTGFRGPAPLSTVPGVDGTAGAASSDGGRQAERTIIAIAAHHPHLFHVLEDDLGTAHFADEGLDALRQVLVTALADGAEDGAALAAAVERAGFGPALAAILNHDLIRSHRLLQPGAAPETVLMTWRENMRLLKLRAGAEERRRLSADLAENPNPEEAWALSRARLAAALEEADGDA